MSLDSNAKRNALRRFTYGLYIVTAAHGETVAGGTITWVTQTSFKPPLVVAGIKNDSSLHKVIRAAKAFAVHVVGKGQKAVAMSFLKGAKVSGQKLNHCVYEAGVTGAPVLRDVPAYLECRVIEEFRRGDHTIFVAEVVAAGVSSEEAGLTLRETGMNYGG